MDYWVVLFLVSLLFVLLCCWFYEKRMEGFQTKKKEEKREEIEDTFNLRKLADDVGIHNLFHKKSKYQDINIIQFNENDFGYDKCLILNDEMQLCNNDEKIYHEMIVHFPAYYLPKLENVLIIGGGDLMTLREVMRYQSIRHVTMLELDDEVMKVSKKYFKQKQYKNDSRVTIKLGDASKTIHTVNNDFYDLVIIDATEISDNNTPLDKQWFFKHCKSKMKEDGILVKNGYVTKSMTKVEKKHKKDIVKKLQNTFDNVNIYTANIRTYDDSSVYSFVMSSDKYTKGDKMRNKEFYGLKKKFTEYEPDKQKFYFKKNI
tara:strand:- start:291 stop:1241 length:951 start_codon:yes stop_codon:yes gene_type:complete